MISLPFLVGMRDMDKDGKNQEGTSECVGILRVGVEIWGEDLSGDLSFDNVKASIFAP